MKWNGGEVNCDLFQDMEYHEIPLRMRNTSRDSNLDIDYKMVNYQVWVHV